MKNYYMMVFSFFIFFGKAQEQRGLFINYDMYINNNGLERYKGELKVTKDISLFSYDVVNESSDFSFSEIDDNNISFTINTKKNNLILTDKKNNLTYTKVRGENKNDFLFLEENIYDIKWEILNDSKKIGNYNAVKIQGKKNNVNYTAWVVLEIYSDLGPYKLTGFPGAVLELSDDKGELHLIATSIEIKNTEEIKPLEILLSNKIINKEDYLKVTQKKMKEIENKIKTKIDRKFDVKVKTTYSDE